MMPIRRGDGTGLSVPGFSEVRKGDGTVLWSSGANIPDSVVSRDADNTSTLLSDKRGLIWDSTVDWPSIGATISANTSGFTTAYTYRISDGTLIDSKDISSLSAGDSFTLDGPFSSSTQYSIVMDAGGSSFTAGFSSGNRNQPYTSSDGQLTIVDGAQNDGTDTAADITCIITIGDVGF